MDNQLNPHQKLKPEIEVSQELKREKHYKLLGSIVLKKGMTLFSYNSETTELKRVKVEKPTTLDYTTKEATAKSKVIHDGRCEYFQALNVRNAKKKIRKEYGLFVKIVYVEEKPQSPLLKIGNNG